MTRRPAPSRAKTPKEADPTKMSEPKVSSPEKAPKAAAAPSVDTKLVRELADVLNKTGLSELEVERGDLRIRLTKSVTLAPTPTFVQAPAAAPVAAVPHAPPAPSPPPPAAAAAAAKPSAAGDIVKSPMVGTVYLQAQPGSPPFAKVGDKVALGQTLLLVEAMKTMNPIAAPKAGVITEYLVVDGQPVEYGEPLVVID
jgi:acetyl-CoA carboxylase biotin carboxyl carrier protein